MSTLKIAAVFADKPEARKVAKASQSLMFEASAETTEHLPFAALVLGTSESLMDLKQHTDVGLYLVNERAVLNQPLSMLDHDMLPVIAGVFPMVANPEIGPKAADTHWREQHAPIALDVHTAMTHYYQISVMHRFSGEDWNGLALCCFANEDDLRNKFYDSPEGKRRVALDVAKFADTRNSPRRVVTQLV
jgi:hypothetical protein